MHFISFTWIKCIHNIGYIAVSLMAVLCYTQFLSECDISSDFCTIPRCMNIYSKIVILLSNFIFFSFIYILFILFLFIYNFRMWSKAPRSGWMILSSWFEWVSFEYVVLIFPETKSSKVIFNWQQKNMLKNVVGQCTRCARTCSFDWC